MKKKLFLVALLGLALIATGCLSRRVDETEAINTVLNEVMQAIVKGDVTYLNTVIVQDVAVDVEHDDGWDATYANREDFFEGFYYFGVWEHPAAQLTARDIKVDGGTATASGAYKDVQLDCWDKECSRGSRMERRSPLRVTLRSIDKKWKVTKLEFLNLVQELLDF